MEPGFAFRARRALPDAVAPQKTRELCRVKVDVDGYPLTCSRCGERLLKTGDRALTFLTDVRTGVRSGWHSDCEKETSIGGLADDGAPL